MSNLLDEHKNNSEEHTSVISLRLKPKHGLMIKGMAKGLNFSASTAFTDMISKHLLDMMVSLAPEDFDAISKKADTHDEPIFQELRAKKAMAEEEINLQIEVIENIK